MHTKFRLCGMLYNLEKHESLHLDQFDVVVATFELKKPAALEPVDQGSSASWPSATAMASWCCMRAFRARARIVQCVGLSGCSLTAELEQHISFIINSSTPVRFAESLKNVARSFVSDRASLTAQMADAESWGAKSNIQHMVSAMNIQSVRVELQNPCLYTRVPSRHVAGTVIALRTIGKFSRRKTSCIIYVSVAASVLLVSYKPSMSS